MRPSKIFPVLLLALFVTARGLAQSVHWEPPGGQLGFNQVSQLSLVFENCDPEGDPALPRIDGLALGQPSQSTETSMVNFHTTTRFSLIYPVRPTKRTGISIPAFDIKTDKGPMNVKAATFTVGDATVGNTGLSVDDIASAKLAAPRGSFWAGEVFPITFSLNIVKRYLHSVDPRLDWQPAPLVVEDWSKPDPSETMIRGERRWVVSQSANGYVKQPGSCTIKPVTQTINVIVGTTGFSFLSQNAVEQRLLESNPLELTIKPLPPAPADFSGAVGEFTFTSKVVPVSAAVGEPITWTLELGGTGNWPDLTGLPQREVSNDFQVVQPKSKRTMKEGSLFEGTLTEDVVLVPTRPGSYRLAPVRFTYFDTKSGTFKTIASEPVTVTVTSASQPVQPPVNSGAPVQFSINPLATNASAAPVLPDAVPPVPPENLPRDPLTGPATGLVPLPTRTLTVLCLLSSVLCVLAVWLALAALRSRERDPQRLRREARARLAAALAELRLAAPKPGEGGSSLLRQWQQQTASLWQIPHAAPGTPLVHASVGNFSADAASPWARLWSEADRALHSRENSLPADWLTRAEGALQTVRVPGWPPFSLFATRNLLPFLFTLALLLAPVTGSADTASEAYKHGDFAAAETAWRQAVTATPADWSARHNLGLALAQQDRWAEATAHWTSASLLNARADATRWDLALGLQRSGMAPPELVEFSRGQGPYKLARWATPAEWQLGLAGAALLLAVALIVLLLQGYRRIGAWAKPVALITSLVAVLLAAAATLSLHTFGPLAHPEVVIIWKPSTLLSIPTDADTSQKTSPLSAGSIAVAEKTFLGWTKLSFPGGQSGWVRNEGLIKLYR